MTCVRWTCTTIASFHVALAASAQTIAAADPLFQDDAPIEIIVTAPLRSLMRERPDEVDLDGRIQYTGSDGNTVEFDVGVRTRGNYRRQSRVCPFPPLRLNFKSSQTKDTLFHKQDKLKLVTHCRNKRTQYNQSVIKEYLAYRILNILTDVSYRVRLLHVNYVDSDNQKSKFEQYAFVIEHKDRLTRRTELSRVDVERTQVENLQPDYTNLVSVFHFMIGNADFSPIQGAAGETCCHNHSLFGREGELYFSIPYDFDMSGIVDAPYATPNPRFKLRSVRDRLYRGRCRNNERLPASLKIFQDNRDKIFALLDTQAELTPSIRKKIISYIEKFYAVIDNPQRVEKSLVKKCI
jgi:hypothetical protein